MTQKNEATSVVIPLKAKIANFLQKNRNILILSILAVAILLASLGIWGAINSNNAVEYAKKVEKLQQDFSDLQSESDEVKKKTLTLQFEKEINDVIAQSSVSYGLMKAYFISGSYKAYQKKWVEAALDFGKVFEKDPKSFFAPVSLANAASCYENAGNLIKSMEIYELFEKNFSDNKITFPEVLFNKGRVQESLKQKESAISSYKKLLEKFPDSNWTKLARDRIITLDS